MVQHNCNATSLEAIDAAFLSQTPGFPEWAVEGAPYITRIVIGHYRVNLDCMPGVAYGVVRNGDFRGYTLIVNPNQLSVVTWEKAFQDLLGVVSGHKSADFGHSSGCTQ